MCKWVRVTAIVSDANACRGLDFEDTPLQCGLCAGILLIDCGLFGECIVAYLNEVLGHWAHTQVLHLALRLLASPSNQAANSLASGSTHCSYCLWASCIVYVFAWIAGVCQCFAYVNPRPPGAAMCSDVMATSGLCCVLVPLRKHTAA